MNARKRTVKGARADVPTENDESALLPLIDQGGKLDPFESVSVMVSLRSLPFWRFTEPGLLFLLFLPLCQMPDIEAQKDVKEQVTPSPLESP